MAIERIVTASGRVKYKAVIYDRGKKHKHATFTKEADARQWEAQEKTALERERHLPATPKTYDFSQVFAEWLEVHAERNKAPNSVVKDKQVYRDYIAPRFAHKRVSEITPANLDEFIGEMTTKTKLKNSSINKILELIRTVLNFSVRRRYIQFNPMAAVKMLPVHEQAFDYWSFDEASEFLSFANGKYHGKDRWIYAFYLLQLTAGLRLGETLALSWENVLFDRGLIRVTATYDRTLKAVKQTTKGRRLRYVPLDRTLKAELMAMGRKDHGSFVFSPDSSRVLDPDTLRAQIYNRDIRESGVRRIRLHDMRHTYASHFVMNGGSLHDLQAILGHADLKMVLRYAHLAPGYIAAKAGVVSFDTDRSNAGDGVVRPLFGVSHRKCAP